MNDPEQPSVRPFVSPFELSLEALCVVAIATVVLAIALFLTDCGVVNW